MATSATSYVFVGLLVCFIVQGPGRRPWPGIRQFDYTDGVVYPILRSAFGVCLTRKLLELVDDRDMQNYLAQLMFDIVIHGFLSLVFAEVFWGYVSTICLVVTAAALIACALDLLVDWHTRGRPPNSRLNDVSEIGQLARAAVKEVCCICLGWDETYVGLFFQRLYSAASECASYAADRSPVSADYLISVWHSVVQWIYPDFYSGDGMARAGSALKCKCRWTSSLQSERANGPGLEDGAGLAHNSGVREMLQNAQQELSSPNTPGSDDNSNINSENSVPDQKSPTAVALRTSSFVTRSGTQYRPSEARVTPAKVLI